MALTGDSIITRNLSVYEEPEYLQMIELIRSADMASTNLQMLFHDYEPFPMAESGGTWMRADPALAKELAWAYVTLTPGDRIAQLTELRNESEPKYWIDECHVTDTHPVGVLRTGNGAG